MGVAGSADGEARPASRPPDGVIELPPDWVCEGVSPGHERKDTRYPPLLLARHGVPFYWLIWPEERTPVAHALKDGEWQLIATRKDQGRGCIPPFDAIELDLADLLEVG